MAKITIRPDLRTACGEVNDIVVNGRYAGTMALVFRERERISGSVQLERDSVKKAKKNDVLATVQMYIQSLVEALHAKECDVVVTWSPYERVIASDNNVGVIRGFYESDEDEAGTGGLEYVQDAPRGEDVDANDRDEIVMRDSYRSSKRRGEQSETVVYELVIVGENDNRVEYHVYDKDKDLLAEAFISIHDSDVVGEINWMFEPSEEESEHVIDLLVSDFDEERIETISLDMMFEGELLETVDLAREDLLEDDGPQPERLDDYSIVLARDDGDTLTYDIYKQSSGGLPVGTATIDIGRDMLSGYIDFHQPGDSEDRHLIATLLMRELDKEKDYEAFNLTMLYNNERIDEVLYETEHVH